MLRMVDWQEINVPINFIDEVVPKNGGRLKRTYIEAIKGLVVPELVKD